MEYRHLTPEEIQKMKSQACRAEDWDRVLVAPGFNAKYVISTRFSGDIRLGVFEKRFELAGGIRKHSDVYYSTLHNVVVGDNCCLENVKNYIANYVIGHDTFIENVDSIITDCRSTFGNGVEVAVLNETGGREVMIHDRLSAHQAYVMALYRHRPALIDAMRTMIHRYAEGIASEVGTIGDHVMIVDSGYIKNVRIGDYAKIEGASRLKNGSVNSNAEAPVHIGVGVIGDDFIIASGSVIEDCVTFSRCFIGQACTLSHSYSASDSLFFSNCYGGNGEACAIFAGPYTVTHHKSTLLIAGMFSFMNAGSGSNQSNHMYKLGPIHQGIMERGSKTSSDSYILWPAKVGAFSLVMGRHVCHQDTSNLPFSYLIEDQGCTYIVPGANLRSVGTIRDARKWPKRDERRDPVKLDFINYNILSPYTMQKALAGIGILRSLTATAGENSDEYSYQGGKIRRSSLKKGIELYGLILDKFLGNSIVSRITKAHTPNWAALVAALQPDSDRGRGPWVDASGLIAPKAEVDRLLDAVEHRTLDSLDQISDACREMYEQYYSYEWTWAYDVITEHYGVDLTRITPEEVLMLIDRWKKAVLTFDGYLLQDAKKEFSLSFMTSFGADGDEKTRLEDFEQVRGSGFEDNSFVQSVRDHIAAKTALYERVTAQVRAAVD